MIESVKRVKASTNKCENCGADLIFNPEHNNLICSKCESEQDFKKNVCEIKHQLEGDKPEQKQDYENWASQTKIIKCENCGGVIELEKLQIATKCPYCSSSYVTEVTEVGGIKPDCVVPFAFNEKEASKKFAEGVKKNYFAPTKLKKQIPTSKISGIYVPSFLFDANTVTDYNGTAEEVICSKDSDGTSTTSIVLHDISGKIEHVFNNVVVESSSRLNEKQITSILPFDISKSCSFDYKFILGYSVEHFDNALENCKKIADDIIEQSIKGMIEKKHENLGNITSLDYDIKRSNEKYCYTLLPIYFFEFNYKKKNRLVFMNGQSGQIGSGLPISALKVSMLVLFFVVIFLGVGALVLFL